MGYTQKRNDIPFSSINSIVANYCPAAKRAAARPLQKENDMSTGTRFTAILLIALLLGGSLPANAVLAEEGYADGALPEIYEEALAETYGEELPKTLEEGLSPGPGEAAPEPRLGEAPLWDGGVAPEWQPAPGYGTAAVTTVTIDRSRNRTAIANMAKALPHSGFNRSKVTQYETEPTMTAPYAAGSLQAADIADAVNALKMVRYIAGLPYANVAFTSSLNNISQHGAVLMAASKQFTHYPSKPSDMSEDFFTLAYRGCNEANIYAGMSNISASVLGFVADSGDNNISRAGHRRWILKPGGQNFGIGYARNTGWMYRHAISMYVFDGPGPWECEADTYITKFRFCTI
jgi:hypothetical protein